MVEAVYGFCKYIEKYILIINIHNTTIISSTYTLNDWDQTESTFFFFELDSNRIIYIFNLTRTECTTF